MRIVYNNASFNWIRNYAFPVDETSSRAGNILILVGEECPRDAHLSFKILRFIAFSFW